MNESRAARHQRLRRRAQAVGLVSGVVLLGTFALTPIGPAVSAWCISVASAMPPWFAFPAALVLFVSLLVAGWELAMLPAVLARPEAEAGQREVGTESQATATLAVAGLVVLPGAVISAAAVQLAIRFAGGWWWPVAGGVIAGVVAVVMHAAPAALARLSGARPIDRPALLERLGVLARQIRVPIHSIDEVSAFTATAMVTGAGGSRRVFIARELIEDWTDDEIAVVVAHEFAHHAHHDLWRTLALEAAILSAGFWTADRVAAAALLPVSPLRDLAALPFVALLVTLVWAAATPIRHAVSRHQERRADAFALRLTGEAEAFRGVLRRLASRHLAEEHPSRLTRWLYHRHPSVAERLRAAETFQARGVNRSNDPTAHRSI